MEYLKNIFLVSLSSMLQLLEYLKSSFLVSIIQVTTSRVFKVDMSSPVFKEKKQQHMYFSHIILSEVTTAQIIKEYFSSIYLI